MSTAKAPSGRICEKLRFGDVKSKCLDLFKVGH